MLSSAVNRARAARRNDKGFTLIELLIVIIILGILAGIVVFSVKGITNNADKNACKTEVSTVDTAEEARYADVGSFTASMTTLQSEGRIHSAPTYVTGYDTTGNKVTLVASPPGGCIAQ